MFKKRLKVQAIAPLMGLETHLWRYLMDLDSFIITVFCLVDDATKEILQGRRLRQPLLGLLPMRSSYWTDRIPVSLKATTFEFQLHWPFNPPKDRFKLRAKAMLLLVWGELRPIYGRMTVSSL